LELFLNLNSYFLVFSLAGLWLLVIAGITVLRRNKQGIVTELKKGFI
jgi:hypothetical protein